MRVCAVLQNTVMCCALRALHRQRLSMRRPQDVDEVEARERTSLWRALTNLLLLLPAPDPAAATDALPEDWQLRAFLPLAAAHSGLRFSASPARSRWGLPLHCRCCHQRKVPVACADASSWPKSLVKACKEQCQCYSIARRCASSG